MHQYKLVSKKGEGTFSEVLKAQSLKHNKYVAIKCMKSHFSSIDKVSIFPSKINLGPQSKRNISFKKIISTWTRCIITRNFIVNIYIKYEPRWA